MYKIKKTRNFVDAVVSINSNETLLQKPLIFQQIKIKKKLKSTLLYLIDSLTNKSGCLYIQRYKEASPPSHGRQVHSFHLLVLKYNFQFPTQTNAT